MSKYIPLTQGKFALVDDDDYVWLSKIKWKINSGGYAVTSNKETKGMHRMIMSASSDTQIDHINCDKLDNRKSNLRYATLDENARNKMKYNIDDLTSKYKGVSWNEERHMWRVHVVREFYGHFTDEKAAANAYNYYAQQTFGEFANLNDVDYMEDWREYRPPYRGKYRKKDELIEINGERKTAKEWAELAGVIERTILIRLSNGWDEEDLLMPKNSKRKYWRK